MAITRWAPFSAFTSLEREMQDMVDKFALRPWSEDFDWRPSTDVSREDGDLVVHAELPGVAAEDVAVEVEGNVLRITGKRESETKAGDDDRFLRERHFGSFRRDIVLPDGVDPDSIAAALDSGVLTVRVPLPEEVSEEPTSRTIHVDVT